MTGKRYKGENSSSSIAIVAAIVLGGLLAVPISFVAYAVLGGLLGGLAILGAIIVLQIVVMAVGQLLLGSAAITCVHIRKMIERRPNSYRSDAQFDR